MNVSIEKTVLSYPKLPYERMKDDILGKRYNLSLVFIGDMRAHRLNKERRNKDYIPNVLSFPLTKSVGEIYIAPHIAKMEAKKFDMSPKGYVGFLFIHALLHLKGHHHGATMEKAEKRYVLKYGLK